LYKNSIYGKNININDVIFSDDYLRVFVIRKDSVHMEKKIIRNIINGVLLLLISIYFVLIVGCVNVEKSKMQIINIISAQINISVPQDTNLIEKYESPIFLHGRLPKYYVFQFDQEPEDFLYDNNFQKNDSDELEQLIIKELEEDNEKYKLKIPKDRMVRFDESYLLVYQENNYCLIYYPKNNELIVFVFSK